MTSTIVSILLVSVVACGHGEFPVAGGISVRASACDRGPDRVEFGATIEVGLEDDQAIRVTFLPAFDGVRFTRTTMWSCGAWTELGVDRGCARDFGQPEVRQEVSVT